MSVTCRITTRGSTHIVLIDWVAWEAQHIESVEADGDFLAQGVVLGRTLRQLFRDIELYNLSLSIKVSEARDVHVDRQVANQSG